MKYLKTFNENSDKLQKFVQKLPEKLRKNTDQDYLDLYKKLHDAVCSNDHKSASDALNHGAHPNIGENDLIDHAKDTEMIKILVSAGAEVNDKFVSKIRNDKDLVEYCIEQGVNPELFK